VPDREGKQPVNCNRKVSVRALHTDFSPGFLIQARA
jgi:hypothetical protein